VTRLYHLALARDWDAALQVGEYTVSTLGRTLADEGFIHLSRADQWVGVRERFYSAVTEPLVLLVIDPEKLTAEVRDDAVSGLDDTFPHLDGPLAVDAVVEVRALGPGTAQ
jgi:uncharacterized protein (DUF952 family)